MSPLTTDLHHDFATGVSVLRCEGDFDVPSAARLRASVLKSLADQPLHLIINLSSVRLVDRLALRIFPPLLDWAEPATHLLLCADPVAPINRPLRDELEGRLMIAGSEAEAVAMAGQWPSPTRVHAHLAPADDAPGLARKLVANFCRMWRLSRLSKHAQLIVTELVSNAVCHARTDIELTILIGRRYLHLQVRDRSRELPVLYVGPRGPVAEQHRGLILVESLASGWGTRLSGRGKTVWATMRFAPLATARS